MMEQGIITMTLFHFFNLKGGNAMKLQWLLLIGLIFAVIIAVFAVVNVEDVPVNYVFGEAEWPLILVILASALLGFLLSSVLAIVRNYQMQRKVKSLQKEIAVKESLIATQQNEIGAYQKVGIQPEPQIVTSEKPVDAFDEPTVEPVVEPRKDEF